MKKILLLILSFLFTLGLISCKDNYKDESYQFTYFSGGNDYTSRMYYSDDYFNNPATLYNNKLATASLSFAMASFASASGSYDTKAKNGINLLTDLGFTNISTNDDYKIKPHADSFGVICGMKEFNDYTLIAVGTRGANYENEWASNFTLYGENKDDYAQGFYDASSIYLASLKEYIAESGITGRIKIWTSGYSRAAATTNIATGRIDIAIKENKVSELIGNVSLKKEDLYAYCFEAPQGVRYKEDFSYVKGKDFNNIFCIINYNDPVPKVAMSVFNYTRYGIDIVLSDSLSDINYDNNLKEITKMYDKMPNSFKLGEYKISNFNMQHNNKWINLFSLSKFNYWSQGIFLQDFISLLSLYGVEDLDYYGTKLQAGLRDIFITLYKNDGVVNSLVDLGITIAREILLKNDASIVMDDLMHNRSQLPKDLTPLLAAALKTAKVDADASEIISGIRNFLVSFAKTLDYDLTLIVPLLSKNNILAIGSAHYPELCLAHLRAMDENYTENPINVPIDGKYYTLTCFDKKANISVKYNGNEIAAFEDGDIIKCDNHISYGIKHNTLIINLPKNANYEISLSSEDILLEENDPNNAIISVVNYDLIKTSDGYKINL